MLIWFQQLHKLEFVAFRYFNAAGASGRFGEHHRIETHLIPNVLKVALGQAALCEIYGTDYATPDGTCIRDYIHIRDLSQAHILGLVPGKQGFFNLGNGDGYSVRQVIETCEKITGKKSPPWKNRVVQAIRPNLLPPRTRPSTNSVGSRNSQSWKTSSQPRGNGIKRIRAVTKIESQSKRSPESQVGGNCKYPPR
jgi:nucleoside-diphosphate-sugar epimerase